MSSAEVKFIKISAFFQIIDTQKQSKPGKNCISGVYLQLKNIAAIISNKARYYRSMVVFWILNLCNEFGDPSLFFHIS